MSADVGLFTVATLRSAIRRSRMPGILGALLLVAGVSIAARADDFVHFESSHVHPLALSLDGSELYAVNTPDARVAFFEIEADGSLGFAGDVPVGIEPVSLAVRPDAPEIWVVNHLSDSLSIVDTIRRRVVATLAVGDEPTDVVFARGRAYVSLAGSEDRLKVYDAETREQVADLVVPGNDPRALAVGPDEAFVHLVVLESGNMTTSIHPSLVAGRVPPPDPPRFITNFPAPRTGLIVGFDAESGLWVDESGRDWSPRVTARVSDHDVFHIDATASDPEIVAMTDGVGTNLFDVAVHPRTGEIWVPNTDSRNRVRFEPNLRGHIVETRVTRVDLGADRVTFVDLNPHIDYGNSPGPPDEVAASVAQPGHGIFTKNGRRFYLASFGSAKVVVLDGATAEVEDWMTVSGGPTGLALREDLRRLFVMSRFENRIDVIDLKQRAVVDRIPLSGPRGFDPSPREVRDGRRFLYDATATSGHGDVSCATCHLFGNFDGIAWDLGDPLGDFLFYSEMPWLKLEGGSDEIGFDPMKGPMVTQTLRGLAGMEPFHWRGDRRNFQAFNGAFVSLLGRDDEITQSEIQAFDDFIMTVQLPPNPYRAANDSLPDAIPIMQPLLPELEPFDLLGYGGETTGDPNEGFRIFTEGGRSLAAGPCTRCHAIPNGTTNLVRPGGRSEDFKVPHLRNVYEKVAFDPINVSFLQIGPEEQKSGFGLQNDGVLSLIDFLRGFVLTPDEERHVAAFLLAFPTETLPCVGTQVTLDERSLPEDFERLDTLLAVARARDCDLIAQGERRGERVGYLYAPDGDHFIPDEVRREALTPEDLSLALEGEDAVTFTAVPSGSGQRMGIDRDRDGCLDGDELRVGTDAASPGERLPDSDDDGIDDAADLCPGWRQTDWSQTDSDGNGRPDECECGDFSNDGFVDLRDVISMAAWLLEVPENRVDAAGVAKCNVVGTPGDDASLCTWNDLSELYRHLWQQWGRDGSDAMFEPLCRPAGEPPRPTPLVCIDEPLG